MSCIKTKSVDVEFTHPIGRIFPEQFSDRLRILIVKGECGAPRSVMLWIKILFRIVAEIVAVWSQVIVNHIEDNPQTGLMRRINEGPKLIGIAVRVRRGVKINP